MLGALVATSPDSVRLTRGLPNDVGGWHLNPDVESQPRYESKYFHEKDLNNSYFVLFPM